MMHVFVCLRHSCLKLIGSAGGITHPRPLPLLGKGDMTHVFVFCFFRRPCLKRNGFDENTKVSSEGYVGQRYALVQSTTTKWSPK